MVTAITGQCSQCGKIWTLDTERGVCQWCGKQATCQTSVKTRAVKARARRKPDQTIPDYHGLTGAWLSFYNVAQAYEGKVPLQDREDIRHDIMLELDRATKRDGKPLPDLRAYRIASLTVALYYREQNRYATRVCIWNGYPQTLHCKECQNKSDSKRCIWLAVRPVADLDGEIIDQEGYRTALLDTVASADIRDMPDKWTELNELKQGLPLRLVEIAYKKREGKPLDKKDQKYLERYKKQAQMSLF